ncbi:hypothetical protein LCGC14_1504850 [marine sediment metagenome]|uniref:Helix-turn-helix domain-containing protein n=1 Tax=marine sediment metagenome TaxID=412755 RepID=A0A0F9LIA6_9ZZZZ
MNTQERKRRIYEIHKSHPTWTYQDIADLVGLKSRQRVQQIVQEVEACDIIESDMEQPRNNHRLNGEPISATQAAREAGIPYYMIADWVRRGLVKVLEHPGHACPGKPVLLDPVSLQERIHRYRPHRRRAAGPA